MDGESTCVRALAIGEAEVLLGFWGIWGFWSPIKTSDLSPKIIISLSNVSKLLKPLGF